MTRIKIEHLLWNEQNKNHIKKHNVSISEVEAAGQKLIYHRLTYEGRYLAIGRSGKRLITLILRRKKSKTYFMITARDASKKERENIYAKEKKQDSRI